MSCFHVIDDIRLPRDLCSTIVSGGCEIMDDDQTPQVEGKRAELPVAETPGHLPVSFVLFPYPCP